MRADSRARRLVHAEVSVLVSGMEKAPPLVGAGLEGQPIGAACAVRGVTRSRLA